MRTEYLIATTLPYSDANIGALQTLVTTRNPALPTITASVLFEYVKRNDEHILSIDIAIPEGEGYGTVVNVVIRENGGVEVVKNDD